MYQQAIYELLVRQGNDKIDPRHIEGYMRLQYGTLDGLSCEQFDKEVEICTACIKEGGVENAESLAVSYGL